MGETNGQPVTAYAFVVSAMREKRLDLEDGELRPDIRASVPLGGQTAVAARGGPQERLRYGCAAVAADKRE
jgi:hypothetical protein